MTAPKFDAGKPRIGLVVPEFIRTIAEVLTFGVSKYGAWSWTKGKEWSKDYDAALRHLLAWGGGEDLDPETGKSHLAHCAADLMFLFVSQLYRFGTDDRHKFDKGA